MAHRGDPVYRLGDYWLARKAGSDNWHRAWYDAKTRSTRRASLGTGDFAEAKRRLNDWFVRNHAPEDEDPGDVLLSDIIRRYYEEHGRFIRSHESARGSLMKWLDYFPLEATVASATKPSAIDKFITHLSSTGKSNAYVNRILTSGRAAINRAWTKGLINAAPHIRSLEVGETEPKGRPLEMDELRLFYHSAEAPHLKAFILWAIGTTARPEAVLELHRTRIDLDRGIVTLNPHGRKQTKKYRPTVKLPDALRPFVTDGWQVSFRGKPCAEIKTAWRNQRNTLGFDARVQPYSLRHTIARHMRASGVPA